MDTIEVLIIGCGIAGATTALRLARNPRRQITIITRAPDPHESNTRYAQGGIIGRGPEDTSELLFEDIVAAGAGVTSPEAARILADEGPPLLNKVLEQTAGVVFDQHDDGTPVWGQEAAHSRRRILHVGDATGRAIMIGLVAALRDLQRELTQPDVPITFTYDEVPKTLPPDVTLCVFRVVQEALHNALKYSHARAIRVHLGSSAKELTLTISDDGVGFDANAAMGKGLGLISIAERLEAVGGTFQIRSQPGAGTALEVRVPLSIVNNTDIAAV